MEYKIIRYFFNSGISRVVRRGITLEEAQEHIKSPESISRSASSIAGRQRTKQFGPWFDQIETDFAAPPPPVSVSVVNGGAAPKRRGRPPKIRPEVTSSIATPTSAITAAPTAPPKRRGRPPKNRDVAHPAQIPLFEGHEHEAHEESTHPPVLSQQPRRRGRPPKIRTSEASVTPGPSSSPVAIAPPKRRGRPPKNRDAVAAAPAPVVAPTAAPKRRGRPPKNRDAVTATPAPVAAVAPVAKRRGRPPKNRAPAAA